jgi:hypothetical protein
MISFSLSTTASLKQQDESQGVLTDNSKSIEDSYEWGSLKIGGGGYLSGLIVGKKEMYIRTDVGGAYKYDYTKKKWVQLLSFINEAKKEYLSVKGIAIDPNDDDIVYFLCGCAYFYPYKTAIFKTTDGGKTFIEIEVSDLIDVHGNGQGRECSEPISVDPDNSNIIYVGGDVCPRRISSYKICRWRTYLETS